MPQRLATLFAAIRGRVPASMRVPVAIWAALVLSTIPFALVVFVIDGKLTGELITLAGLVAAVGLIALLGGPKESG